MKIIAGPCQHETFEQSLEIAQHCKAVCDEYGIEYIFKASFDKANRTHIKGTRGQGLHSTMQDFEQLKSRIEDLKILTDVHSTANIMMITEGYYDSVDVFVFDATHAVQKPGGQGNSSGGNRAYVPGLLRAASAMGVDNFFLEVHPDPDNAPSDGPNMLKLNDFDKIVKEIHDFNYDRRIQ